MGGNPSAFTNVVGDVEVNLADVGLVIDELLSQGDRRDKANRETLEALFIQLKAIKQEIGTTSVCLSAHEAPTLWGMLSLLSDVIGSQNQDDKVGPDAPLFDEAAFLEQVTTMG